MNTKGTAVKAAREFVTRQYGTSGCEQWLRSLPEQSRSLLQKGLLASAWYPYHEALELPLQAICDQFYQGDHRGAWDEGRFCANSDLHGIYRAFVKIATPNILVRNSAMIFGSYFNGATLKVAESTSGRVVVRLAKEGDASRYFDHNVAGWMEYALELCGCRDLNVSITATAADNGSHTEITMTWS
jgi:hypothetical protein